MEGEQRDVKRESERWSDAPSICPSVDTGKRAGGAAASVGEQCPPFLQTKELCGKSFSHSLLNTTFLLLLLPLLLLTQTRNGYEIWLQAEKSRIKEQLDKCWHYQLPRPHLWPHTSPTDYHRAYSCLLEELIWSAHWTPLLTTFSSTLFFFPSCFLLYHLFLFLLFFSLQL